MTPSPPLAGNKKLGGTQDLDCLSTQTCHLQERRRSSFNLDSSPGDGNVLTGRRRSSAARALGLVEAQLLDGKLRQFWAVVMVTRAVAAMSAPRRRRLVGMEKDPFFTTFLQTCTSLYVLFYNLGNAENQKSHHTKIHCGRNKIQKRQLYEAEEAET